MRVAMELSRIVLNDIDAEQVLLLKEAGGERCLAIPIGFFEAKFIRQRAQGILFPRPQSHDLLLHIISGLGGELEDVVISDRRGSTFFARLRIRYRGKLIEVDARPSDAIALAVTERPPLPIYVASSVLERATSS